MAYTDISIERDYCTENLLQFTRYMFYHKNNRKFIIGEHHIAICNAIDDVINGKTKRLIINIAPRYGKTELVSKMFIALGFALNPASKFIHISYSDDLVKDNSREISELMRSDYFTRLFPEVVVDGFGAKQWRTTAGGGMYAVASGGQITGFGAGRVEEEDLSQFMPNENHPKFAGAIVIDDPHKPEDALSDLQRERVNTRFETTIRSRVNSRNTPIVIVMQRLHEHDLCGYLQQNEPNEWSVLSLPCLTIDEDGNERALWNFKHSVEELHKLEMVNPFVFQTQYQQNPTPLEGLMYTQFKTYDTLPVGARTIRNYTDTADTGSDYLCSICYAEYTDGMCYVLDVLFTNKPMEFTEPETARMLTRNNVQNCIVESNGGGRGFRRNVERNCREMGNRTTTFEDYTQSQNKQSRIFSRSNEVQNMVVFPNGWEYRFTDYYKAMKSYRKEGSNIHDDAPDATTGIVEHIYLKSRNHFGVTGNSSMMDR